MTGAATSEGVMTGAATSAVVMTGAASGAGAVAGVAARAGAVAGVEARAGVMSAPPATVAAAVADMAPAGVTVDGIIGGTAVVTRGAIKSAVKYPWAAAMETPLERIGEPAVGSAASAEEIDHASLMEVSRREDTVGGVEGAMAKMRGARGASDRGRGDSGIMVGDGEENSS